jgi:hypothetical protein
MFRTTTFRITGAAAAGAAAVVLGASILPRSADALSADEFKIALEKQGYQVTVDPKLVDHPSLEVDGRVFTISKGGKTVKAELFEYGNITKLRVDWKAENGSGPRPIDTTTDFNGDTLLWNEDSVLAIDRAASDSAAARAVQAVYLGPDGTGGENPPPSNPPGTPKPPDTGSGVLDDSDGVDGFTLAVAAGIVTAGLAAGGAAVATRRSRG